MGRSPMSMVAEYWKLHRKPGRLTLPEYFDYNLYDDSLYDAAAKERFITERLHWPITNLCSDITWRAATEDKWLSYKLLQHLGAATPQTLAVIDRSGRPFRHDPHIARAHAHPHLPPSPDFPPLATPPPHRPHPPPS